MQQESKSRSGSPGCYSSRWISQVGCRGGQGHEKPSSDKAWLSVATATRHILHEEELGRQGLDESCMIPPACSSAMTASQMIQPVFSPCWLRSESCSCPALLNLLGLTLLLLGFQRSTRGAALTWSVVSNADSTPAKVVPSPCMLGCRRLTHNPPQLKRSRHCCQASRHTRASGWSYVASC